MKVLYVATNQDLSQFHGGTVHILAVTQELIHHGKEVHLVCQSAGAHVPIPDSAILHPIKPRHPFLLWMAGNELRQLIETIRPDVVMERYYNFAGEAIFLAKQMGIPTILEVNSPMMEPSGSWKSRADILLLGALKRRRERMASAAKVILSPIPEIIAEPFREKTRLTEWGADVNAFDPALFADRELVRLEKNFPTDELIFVHFGSLRKWHGLVTLLEAFDIARKQLQQPGRLIVIGPSPKIEREQVSFTGTIPHTDLPGWLKMCDIAVLPFSLEAHRPLQIGFFWSPLKIFEAMSMELPLITLNHPRLRSILGSEDPAFYYDGSTQELAERMVTLARQVESFRQTAKQFRNRVIEHYSWQAHGNQLNEICDSVVQP